MTKFHYNCYITVQYSVSYITVAVDLNDFSFFFCLLQILSSLKIGICINQFTFFWSHSIAATLCSMQGLERQPCCWKKLCIKNKSRNLSKYYPASHIILWAKCSSKFIPCVRMVTKNGDKEWFNARKISKPPRIFKNIMHPFNWWIQTNLNTLKNWLWTTGGQQVSA